MNQQAIDYRATHGVVPQLDFVNNQNCMDTIEQTPVVYSKFVLNTYSKKNLNLMNIPKGIAKSMGGLLSMVTMNFGYGIAKFFEGTLQATVGVFKSDAIAYDAGVTKHIREAEDASWPRYQFLSNFVPAEGTLGSVYFKDGSCDEFHCGNGYQMFENGDYFEGYFEDGVYAQGVYIWANGERFIGSFQDGEKVSGLTIYPDGTRCDGNYANGVLHGGVGTKWYTDGVYWGNWYNGKRQGTGFCRFGDNTSFAGEWQNDSPVA